MSFYIKFENGSAVGNPMASENLQQLYPNFLDDPQSLGYYPVDIVHPPCLTGTLPTYSCFPHYTLEEDNTVSMYYVTRKLNAEEKQRKYNDMLDIGPIYTGWILNANTLYWEAPFPMPEDSADNVYIWSNVEENWVIQPTE